MHGLAWLPIAARILVSLGYVLFFAFLLLHKRPKAQEHVAKRESTSRLGIVLQMVAFALVWMIQRPIPHAGTPLGGFEITLDVLAPLLSAVSSVFGLSAVRTLGKEWSYEARLVEGHRLVTAGPYRVVRHPIYTALFGKLLATNFAFGHPLGLLAAGAVFVVGTTIRIRSEEKLLREAFGAEYADYARRVPAFIPIPKSA